MSLLLMLCVRGSIFSPLPFPSILLPDRKIWLLEKLLLKYASVALVLLFY